MQPVDATSRLLSPDIHVQAESCKSRQAVNLSVSPQLQHSINTHNPRSENVNKLLYIRQTMTPVSFSQVSTRHMCVNVPLMYHVSTAQEPPQSIDRKPLMRRLRRGFRPMQQCMIIVNASATTEKRDAASNYDLSVHKSSARRVDEHTKMNVQGTP